MFKDECDSIKCESLSFVKCGYTASGTHETPAKELNGTSLSGHNLLGGIYVCAKCGNELFNSEAKYKHATPWPAFTQTINPDSVRKTPESSTAIKLACGQCFNSLGHEFIGDGPTPGLSRF